jgi:hypothetical protein
LHQQAVFFIYFQSVPVPRTDHNKMLLFPRKIRPSHLVMAAHFIALIVLVSTCDYIGGEKLSGVVHFSGEEFAGSQTCIDCHKAVAESHVHTPHFLTSAIADAGTVRGNFDSGQNVLILNEGLKVVMEKTQDGFFQRGYVDGAEINRKPMDITIGSGRQGQTYLYWDENMLHQLPVSYYTASDSWSNSPGYPNDQLIFTRPITARCLECHSTYFKLGKPVGSQETFERNQVMLGVDCERCHGPAGRHVTFHRKHPDEKEPMNIINPARLSRERKLDNCALCHSGIRENILPSFSYVVGENLDDYSYPGTFADSAATLDVHGNQYGLLTASKCFRMSKMDCSTCHNVHVKETNKTEMFSARCMSCHVKGGEHFCKQPEIAGLELSKNCIDCHMPALPSRQVFLQEADGVGTSPFFVRTHLIGVYEEKVKEFLTSFSAGDGVNK